MRFYDVFNGDADGICALHQLRLADPADAVVVTGLKREIELLRSVPAQAGDLVTVLDISLDRNRHALLAMLARGVRVRYFDHHYAGPIPAHPLLTCFIDEGAAACTSAIVDRHLGGRHRLWAVVGAFGDNLADTALELARALDLDAAAIATLRELGAAINYNAYGDREADVLLPPARLYRIVASFADPFALARDEPVIARLAGERAADLERACALKPLRTLPDSDTFMLPDAQWSRRVSGTFANYLAASDPARAHAVLTPRPEGGYAVSVRSPRSASSLAVDVCHRFAHGGGRRGAAGIDHLEPSRLETFLEQFAHAAERVHVPG
jgi:hypothetical protein